MLAIACGYEDADDLDHLHTDPGFKLACGRLPNSGAELCSQPTVSRWENAPTLREVIRMSYAMVDIYCASHARPPYAVTLDIDDTVDVVHGHQQLALFNAHYDERSVRFAAQLQPIHVYDTATSRPVAMLLRPGKTPLGAAERELRGVALGRRAWLFAGADRGGERAAAMYSLIATAKLNGIDPRAWLADVLGRIADHPASRLHELLPWHWSSPPEDRRLEA